MEKSSFYQILALVVNWVGSLGSGIGFGYMGAYGHQVMEELGIEDSMHSWVVGCVTVGGLMGCLVAGKLSDIIGRKRASIVYYCINIVGWSIVTFSPTPTTLFCGRTLHGLGEGMGVVITILYLGELVQTKYRGGALAALTIAACFGIAFAYILGVLFTWRVSAGIVTLINTSSCLVLMLLPESPYWLTLHDSLAVGLEALQKVGAAEDEEELRKTDSKSKIVEENSDKKTSITLTMIISTSVPPLLLFLFPISGIYSVAFFATHLAESMNLGHSSAVAIAVGLVRTLGASVGTGFVQKFGRRKSMIISSGMTTACLALLFLILLVKSLEVPLPEPAYHWVVVILLLLAMLGSSLGMAPVPWILAGEWPAFKHKGYVGTAGTALFYSSVFLASQLTSVLQESVGMPGMFLVFSCLAAIYLGITIIMVPETGGASYQQFVNNQKLEADNKI